MKSFPMPDNIHTWQTTLPTKCAFCRVHSDFRGHIFLHCQLIQSLWREISILFSGTLPGDMTILNYLLRWWCTSSKSHMLGQLRIVVPSLVVWVIWKVYTSICFVKDCFSYRRLLDRVRDHIYIWCASTQGSKFSQNIPHLVTRFFSPSLRSRRHKIVRWELPPSGKLKLNVDAAVDRCAAAAGAVLHNRHGESVSAICFILPPSSPLRAELMALQYALIYFAARNEQLLIETNCRDLLKCLSSLDKYTGLFAVDRRHTLHFLRLNTSSISYCPRESTLQPILSLSIRLSLSWADNILDAACSPK